ncbi:hypothetical protein [Microbulbifer litoralis]|uniref:hypothetical protein n=1 Tax=Microbulbifer litoralis TaxID=2933965 RepID=UPI0020287932|nr:hypothetical protein [Microbulbifer sp. GX H0434]
MKQVIVLAICSLLLTACSMEERPLYTIYENTLPDQSPTIQLDPEAGLANMDQVTAGLKGDDLSKFNRSLEWYGTESHFGLNRIEGKTARQLVDLVNCLKQEAPELQKAACFE